MLNIEYAVLSLVRMHPDVTGYQIKAIFDHTPGHVVPLHLSKIYPALRKLTEQGFLEYRSVPQKGRLDQKFYTITKAGNNELIRWFTEPFEFGENRSTFDFYILRLGAMSYMEDKVIRDAIDQGIAYLEERIKTEGSDTFKATGLDFITIKSSKEKARYDKLFNSEYDYLEKETKARLKWLKDLRKSYE